MSLTKPKALSTPKARTSESVLITLLSLLGVNAVWGTTGDHTLISGWLDQIATIELWTAAILVAMVIMGTPNSRIPISGAGNRLARWLSLFLAGVFVAESLYQELLPLLGGSGVPIDDYADPLRFALHRVFFVAPAIPLLLFYRNDKSKPLSFLGHWSTPATLPKGKSTTWKMIFVAVMICLLAVTAVLQAGVGFQPAASGWLVLFLPALLLTALVNSAAEETLFRGAIQPIFVGQSGERGGVWLQAVLFGILHLGASPAPLDVMTTAGVATALGLLWGYATLRTRGLGFAIVTHMVADFTFISVQYWPG